MLFNERDFLDRFAAAATAGFKAVEFLFPYAYDKAQIKEKLEANGLKLILHNLPAGDWAAGERGIGCLPNRVAEFRSGVENAIAYASELGCSQLNCLAGIKPANVDEKLLRETLVENLRYAADLLTKFHIRLLVEPINTRDIPGFYLTHTEQAVEIIHTVGSDNLRLQYDVYHMQIMEGDLASTIKRNLNMIAHVQVADNPGRHEQGTGEINYPFLFEFLDSAGYQGGIGCEYKPRGDTLAGLRWLATRKAS